MSDVSGTGRGGTIMSRRGEATFRRCGSCRSGHRAPSRRSTRVGLCVVASVLAGLLLSTAVLTAQTACRTVEGTSADSVRNRWEERNALRDSVREILAEAGALDSAGAVLVWTEGSPPELNMALVNLDPPEQAYYRIRGLLAGFFQGRATSAREVAIDLDQPSRSLPAHGPLSMCGGRPSNDDHLRGLVEKVVRKHPDFGRVSLDASGMVRVFVDWRGNVLHSVVTDSTGDAWFDKALRPLAREMKFEPFSLAGIPVGTWTARPVRFRGE